MIEVRRSADCGNSPKNQFAEEFVLAVLTGDRAKVEQASVADLKIEQTPAEGLIGIDIENVVTHGRAGAVNGTVTSRDGRKTGFCFVLAFASAKADRVAKVTRYTC
jgi:hypothetical protein